jgi:hypothetical protein
MSLGARTSPGVQERRQRYERAEIDHGDIARRVRDRTQPERVRIPWASAASAFTSGWSSWRSSVRCRERKAAAARSPRALTWFEAGGTTSAPSSWEGTCSAVVPVRGGETGAAGGVRTLRTTCPSSCSPTTPASHWRCRGDDLPLRQRGHRGQSEAGHGGCGWEGRVADGRGQRDPTIPASRPARSDRDLVGARAPRRGRATVRQPRRISDRTGAGPRDRGARRHPHHVPRQAERMMTITARFREERLRTSGARHRSLMPGPRR